MRVLNRKILREAWLMKGQIIAIAIVITSGVATFVMSTSTLDSLQFTQSIYYRDYRFADLFATLKRAPERLLQRIADIPGVDQVQGRIVGAANVDIRGFPEPVSGQIISVVGPRQTALNRLYLRAGRLPDPARDDEVVVSEAFAEGHGLRLGEELSAVINGHQRKLRVSGIALSPEFIYEIGPGMPFPDNKRFGVMWMAHAALASNLDMDGSFNDLVLRLAAGADAADVITALDRLLEPYAGLGAITRKDQLSYNYLSEEFKMLARMATLFPVIFLSVSVFLLNVVIGRLISTQREQIAVLKAFGYSNIDVGAHYLKLVALIVAFGVAAGLLAGAWLGQGLSALFMDFYRFPFLEYRIRAWIVAGAAVATFGAAMAGTVYAVSRAARLPPAQAMRPQVPERYRQTLIERMGFQRWLSQPTRMILRHLERQPLKSFLSMVGIAFACGIVMVGSFQEDAVDYMMDVQYGLASRDDVSVSFTEPTGSRAVYDLLHLPGVYYAEPFRVVPARFRFGRRSYRSGIQGLETDGDLRRVLNTRLQAIELPPDGVVLTDYLAKLLGIGIGDTLSVEVLEGARPKRSVVVAALVGEFMGLSAYMQRGALNRMMGEGDVVSGAFLAADHDRFGDMFKQLKQTPRIAGSVVRQNAMQNFRQTFADTLLIFTFINTLLASSIAFGVIYNSARIAVSERGRELASLRVLGFSRGEISYIMLGELGVLVLLAIPIGLVIGYGLCAYIAANLQTELYRVPLVLEPGTYSFAALVVLIAAALSAFMVRRRLDRLDLIKVLKTKE